MHKSWTNCFIIRGVEQANVEVKKDVNDEFPIDEIRDTLVTFAIRGKI